MSDHLWNIRAACLRLIDTGTDALDEPLANADGADSPEARVILGGAVSTTKMLLTALEKSYEFSGYGGGLSEPKEDPCRD